VVSPGITILGPGRVSGRAIVDLDQIREEHKPTSLFDPMRFLRGRLPITATGGLATSNGVATFQFESAEISGLPIPKLLLQQIVGYYSRSPERPPASASTIRCAPARIREIQLQRGQAIVINSDRLASWRGRRWARHAAAVSEGRGSRRAADLAHAGLLTLDDLLRFPIRYEDRATRSLSRRSSQAWLRRLPDAC
jgi:hypothetical protein